VFTSVSIQVRLECALKDLIATIGPENRQLEGNKRSDIDRDTKYGRVLDMPVPHREKERGSESYIG
jgi:hypothetical protein